MPHRLAARRLIAWYGDDFTGSTDVLEVLATRGIESALFLSPPSDALRERFGGYRAFGLAGSSRSRSPEWMDANLPEAFRALDRFETPLVHYKVCSTFDSAPETGNIGRALEIGRNIFRASCVPIVAGAPALGRYTAFGNLFARSPEGIARIDRHPMSRHPVTPMLEADLRLHLAKQTALRIGLIDLTSDTWTDGFDAMLIDVLDDRTLARAGALAWNRALQGDRFIVGSSGVEYSLAAHWGLRDDAVTTIRPADRLVVLSGSCSPVTGRQIRAAAAAGFELIPAGEDAASQAICELKAGKSVVIHSAIGPEDQLPAGAAFREQLATLAGRTLTRVLDESDVRRGGGRRRHVIARRSRARNRRAHLRRPSRHGSSALPRMVQ
ncbi:MAG: four-carbon acid sugar kinase family protein [Bryobacteraceae bacterium]